MALISLKISNVHENSLELIQRLRGVKSPGKKLLLDAIASQNWEVIYEELLYRVELYSQYKVLNYSRKDLNDIVLGVRKVGIKDVVKALITKLSLNISTTPKQVYVPVGNLVLDDLKVDELHEVLFETSDEYDFKSIWIDNLFTLHENDIPLIIEAYLKFYDDVSLLEGENPKTEISEFSVFCASTGWGIDIIKTKGATVESFVELFTVLEIIQTEKYLK